jgi:hypothetical protein
LLLAGPQPANPLPLLAEIHGVEEQAEGVRNLGSLGK